MKRWVSLLRRHNSNPYALRFPAQAFPCLAFAFLVHLPSMFMYAISCDFLFFPFIQKFITSWIIVQMRWGFLHDVPHDVYYFMMIFPEIVHAWIFILPRECSYMCFLDMPCHFACEIMDFNPTPLKFCVLKVDSLMNILV